MSIWKTEQIAEERRKRAVEHLAEASREELIERIVALETSLYKLTYTWNELDFAKELRRSAICVSPLFPDTNLGDESEDGGFYRYNAEAGKFQSVTISMETLHQVEFEKQESITIDDGTKLSDELHLLEVHGNATACSIYGGAICMGDVREAARLLWGKP